MASIAAELSLYSKFSGVFAPELGWHIMVDEDPNGTSELEDNLHFKVFFDTHTLGSRRRQRDGLDTNHAFEAWLSQSPIH